MKCEEVIELMQRDLDGDLIPEEKKKLSNHLYSCYGCQTLFDKLKNVSFQLEALPKVTPAYSIVDKVLPVLDQIDQPSGQNVTDVQQASAIKNFGLKYKGFKKNKKLWIPSIAAAAVLFVTFVVMDQSSRLDMGLLSSSSQEETYDTASNEVLESSDMAGTEKAPADNAQMFSTAPPENHNEIAEGQYNITEGTVPEASTFGATEGDSMREDSTSEGLPKDEPIKDDKAGISQEQEENQEPMTKYEVTTEDEATKYASPDDVYTAHEGLGGGDILIQKENRAYYITKNTWEEPWEIELIEWVSNHELYYELYHPEKNEREYWIVNADERTEEQLEESYHSQ
jgi:hypothetical protein